jgi:hypothetical protein
MNKLIREGRFGSPKTFKTGAVCGTYPRPLLLLNIDEEGYSVFPRRNEPIAKGFIPFEVFAEDLVLVKPSDLSAFCKQSADKLPPVTVIDVVDMTKQRLMTDFYVPIANDEPLKDFVSTVNTLIREGCPWRTVVVDSVTGLNEVVLSHVAATNKSTLLDPRKWAPMCGNKIAQMIGVLSSLSCHFVCIFHESFRENEATQEIRIAPLVHSQVRDRIGGLFSQWLYAFKQNNQPKIRTNDFGLVKGVGCRWPLNLPDITGPTYKEIYGGYL